MLKVSCILTSYNRPNGVSNAIASVQSQTYPHWELLIVDDNSNIKTKQIIRDIVRRDNRCTLIESGVREQDRHKTTRYATCINMALKKITGDLVTYLTDDDIYYPHRFKRMVEVFEKNPNIYVLYGRQRVVHIKQNEVERVYIRPLVGVTRTPMRCVDHNSFMHRRECLEYVKEWNDDPSLWRIADIGFFSKLVQYWDFHPLNVITDEHRIHEKSVQSKIDNGRKPWEEKDAE